MGKIKAGQAMYLCYKYGLLGITPKTPERKADSTALFLTGRTAYKTGGIMEYCIVCGKPIPDGRRKDNSKYCSLKCLRKTDTGNTYKRISGNNHKGYLSKQLISLYNGRCAICGWRACESLITANGETQHAYGNEIHHIIPVKNGGKASLENLILLCPNHHKQADLGLIAVEELKSFLKELPTEEESRAMRNNAVDRIAGAIFSP